jgi:hypothetical protein
VQYGLIGPEQGRRAMRWVESHLCYTGDRPEVKLMMSSDYWPVRWSNQWVATGDTLLAAMAGMKCGDADLWWPYVRTAVNAAFRSHSPGIPFGISNTGAGGGGYDLVDSDDPHIQMAVRGLFGIEPYIHEGRIDICPAFPSDWTEASIKTPDISYHYTRKGNVAAFRIKTPKPLIKRVRADLTGKELVTPAETESVLRAKLGPGPPPWPESTHRATIISEVDPNTEKASLTVVDRKRLAYLDLSSAYNHRAKDLADTEVIFDYEHDVKRVKDWWNSPAIAWSGVSGVIESPDGVSYKVAGSQDGSEPKNLLAVSTWRPYSLPGAVKVPVGQACEKVCLLLQSYVHPIKNYIPNGEIILHYTDGSQAVTQLIPPFNLDCYFQHFSREGTKVPLGELVWPTRGFQPIDKRMTEAHADSLIIRCDSKKALRDIEIRATCSEAIIGVAGISVITTVK